ncbi:MAG: sigma-54 dependent transcriptional regulator [Sterolibacterium sp.]|nr:sigma-54 dependent transcriptional regulator [Sterolibacterium sp.]
MSVAAKLHLCLIEDDDIVGDALVERFELENYDCTWFRTGREALLTLPRRQFDVVISDIRLPDMSGEKLYMALLEEAVPLPPYLFITGYGEIDQAVRLLKLGAADYIKKPFDIETLLEKIGSLVTAPMARDRQPKLGISPAMRTLESMLDKIGGSTSNVLISGESGVGKEMVARELHLRGNKDVERPFVAVNCGAFADSLLEAELFGFEKGAFTGAVRMHKGVFEQANGGTLLLDEVGDMSQSMQIRLLRAIQERCITRIGGEHPLQVSLRLICATHRDLKQMVENREFREDLYYRINVVHLYIPPLRDRKEDILWLARQFLEEEAAVRGGAPRFMSAKLERLMLDNVWPGNVRELKHALERACVLSEKRQLLPESLFEEMPLALPATNETLAEHLNNFERQYISRVLAAHNGHVTHAAETLGISRKNMWERMKRYGIQRKGDD